MLDRVEGRLAFIKTELKVTEAQASAWNQLAETIRAAAKNHNERMKAAFGREEKAKTLPERLDPKIDAPDTLIIGQYLSGDEKTAPS
jgi:hypothetical protein